MDFYMIFWIVMSALTAITSIVLALVFMRRARKGRVLLLTGSALIALWSILQILVISFRRGSFCPFPDVFLDELDGFSAVLLPVGLILLILAAIRAGNSPKANQPAPSSPPLTPPAGPPASYPPPQDPSI